jgi:ABC-type nitrate/sulfonate/bicarbonate transport system substrate-binding protein
MCWVNLSILPKGWKNKRPEIFCKRSEGGMKMRSKSILSVIVALAFFSLAFALSPVGTEAGEVEYEKLVLHFQPNDVFAPHSVGIKKGWFKEAGFKKIEWKTFTAGALAGEALIGGEIHVWNPGNLPVISMRHNGVPVVIAGVLTVCPAEYLYVRNDAGVKKPEDLYKIRIGLLAGSTQTGVMENLALHYGLDPSKFEIVNLPPPEQVTSLLNNDIQASPLFPPFSYYPDVRAVATYMFDSLAFSHTNVPVVFTESFIRKNPNAAKAILEVLLRGQAYCENPGNKEEVMKIHQEFTEQSMEIIEMGWEPYWGHPDLPNGPINERFVADMQNYTDFLQSHGRIKDAMHPLDYTYTGFLEEVKPEFVEIKGKWKP